MSQATANGTTIYVLANSSVYTDEVANDDDEQRLRFEVQVELQRRPIRRAEDDGYVRHVRPARLDEGGRQGSSTMWPTTRRPAQSRPRLRCQHQLLSAMSPAVDDAQRGGLHLTTTYEVDASAARPRSPTPMEHYPHRV
jgi:hypothetical protein